MELSGKNAVITGASKGIGRSIALTLARAGVNVAIAARSADKLESLAKEVRELGVKAHVFVGDMSSETDIIALIKQTEQEFGGIDILINNAGLGHFAPVAELSTAHWDEMFNLNVRGLFIATREALPWLRKASESAVINIASLASKNSFPSGGGYAATKHAVLGFSRCLMLEERKNGVRVLAICPGSVNTEFALPRRGEDDPKNARILQSEDVSDCVLAMLKLPQNAMLSEIDLRPTNP